MNTDKHYIPKINREISIARLPICYNHGCSFVQNISVSTTAWRSIQLLFLSGRTGFEERLAIRNAIALLEEEAAIYTPVGIDLPKNNNEGELGRQDCLDESTNSTHFLLLLQDSNLLRWHTVGSRVYRAHFILDQHYAAQIIHKVSGERYVVDSWYLANAELPYVQPYQDWAYKKSFSKKDNPITGHAKH